LSHACLSKKNMLPKFYQTHLQKQLTPAQFILLTILLTLIQSEKQVRLERKSASVSLPNYHRKASSQITKISRFTSINDRTNLVPINHLLVNNLLLYWTNFMSGDRSYVNGGVSIYSRSPSIRQKRAISLYWCLLSKLGNSNLSEQILPLQQVLPLLKKYKIIVLGDSLRDSFASREFCSVDLRSWRAGNGCIFLLEDKKES